MLEELESLVSTSLKNEEGLTDSQIEYLSEFNLEDSEWDDLNEVQQLNWESGIDGRMDELGIDIKNRSEVAHQAFSDDLAEAYDSYLVEQYERDLSKLESQYLEAPQDHIQIEQISEAIINCEEMKYENWKELELSEKEAVLNSLEDKIAEIEHRPACPVQLSPLGENTLGGYNPETKEITFNRRLVEKTDFVSYREVIDTLIHEGRHAYQDYNVNVTVVHPRHSEVVSWSETMGGGKWKYWGDCSSILGQRLYEQQSCEIDARNFASDVLDELNLNPRTI